ncbi:MAG: pilus assembly protein CpaD [Altererythrobacter sp.]|nr:pilus assembly protein CpaD [Altererythrobacter sp.]
MPFANRSKLAGALALSLGLALGACGGMPTNKSLYSVNQPVVERNNYTFDVQSSQSGLSIADLQRLDGWFEALELGYGDRVSIDDPLASDAVLEAVSQLAGRHGVLLSDEAPVTSGASQPGYARVIVTRSKAHVPGCPNWSATSDMNYNNGTSPNYGCATKGNLAAMIANPEDLIEGQKGTGETVIMSSSKAIETYRDAAPTGAGGLSENATGGN